MHRSFQIKEIRSEIVSHIDHEASLAALAQTSQLFQDPALNILWRKQDTLYHLARCFPSDLVIEEVSPDTGGLSQRMRLLRPIVATDWERPLFYSRRVRHFDFQGPDYPVDLSDWIFSVLSLSLPGDYVFPNLESLDWFSEDSSSFPFICLFLGPSVTSLSVTYPDLPSYLSLLSALSRKHASLTAVTLTVDWENDVDGRYISLFANNLTRIETLAVPGLDWSALQHLSGLATLRSLRLDKFIAPISCPLFSSTAFSALESINIGETDASSATRLIAVMSSAPLRSLYISFATCISTARMSVLYRAIAANISRTTLTQFRQQSAVKILTEAEQRTCMIDNNAMRSLCCFPNLVGVAITSPAGFELDDDTLADLACAWPRLESLSLIVRPGTAEPRVTLAALHHLAKHCSQLRTLRLPFDATVVPPAAPMSGKRVVHVALQSLYIEDCPIEASPPVSRFLSGIFPNVSVDIVRCSSTRRDRWMKVREQLLHFVAAREEERAWARHRSVVGEIILDRL
ncbi:hypothetical protein GGX14DRAFT_454450 [Mycena pura]|uniref:F-box domain-containing protein n=1 Tax=Mycena pura TaxID=153505 RepID=A0AAD6VBP2_9AGAR|nr:hypothetical protein GGX14DRAFT_454450 [Mycena pura]